MDDYLTRVAEAVRDATLNKAWQIGNSGPLRSAVDLPAVIASVPRPEPVAWRHSHTHSLHDLAADVELADGDEWAEPLYAEPVAAQQSDDAATLRSAIRAMASMLQAREWAEHVSADPIVTDLEVQITELVGTATKLREQNATLGEAISLQHANGEALAERVMQAEAQNAALVAAMQNIADEFVPGDEQKLYGTPTDALDRIRSTARATLASAKGGAA